MQDTILLWALALGTALLSGSGASELVVALLVATTLLFMAVRSFLPTRHRGDDLDESGHDARPRHS